MSEPLTLQMRVIKLVHKISEPAFRLVHLSECFETDLILHTPETGKLLAKLFCVSKPIPQKKEQNSKQTKTFLSMLDLRWLERQVFVITAAFANYWHWGLSCVLWRFAEVQEEVPEWEWVFFFFLCVCIIPSDYELNWVSSHATPTEKRNALLSLFLLTQCQSALRTLRKYNRERCSNEGLYWNSSIVRQYYWGSHPSAGRIINAAQLFEC